MRRSAAKGVFGALFIALPAAAVAQPGGRNEIAATGGVGVGNFSIERRGDLGARGEFTVGLEHGNDVLLGVRYSHMFSSVVGAEVVANVVSNTWRGSIGQVVGDSVIREYRSIPQVSTVTYAVCILLSWPLAARRIQPFVSAGPGGISRDTEAVRGWIKDSLLMYQVEFGTSIAVTFGGGVAWYPARRWGLRGEVRDWVSRVREVVGNETLIHHNPTISVGAGFVF
jgi:hypothetical protein